MRNSKTQKRINRLLALLLVVLVVLCSFTACNKNEEDAGQITNISDLNGKIVGVAIGSMHEDIAKHFIPNCTIHYYNSPADLAAALNSGVVDGIICDGAVSLALIKENDNLAIISDPLSTNEYEFEARALAKISEPKDSTLKESLYDTFIADGRMDMLIDGFKTTALISFTSIIIGGLLGFLYFSFCWSKTKPGIEAKIATLFVWIVKATPILVFLMILYYVVFAKTSLSATTIAIIGFTLAYMASTESTFHSAFKELNHGEEEAAISLGYKTWQIYYKFVLPPLLENASTGIKNEIVSLVQATSIVGYIAVQDITKVSDIIRGRTFDAFFPLLVTTILYFALCWIFVDLVRIAEYKFNLRRRTPDQILKGVEHK